MDRRLVPFPQAATSPCQCCGRIADLGAVEPIGILEGPGGKTPLILYQCACNNTRAIPWTQASEETRRKARKKSTRSTCW